MISGKIVEGSVSTDIDIYTDRVKVDARIIFEIPDKQYGPMQGRAVADHLRFGSVTILEPGEVVLERATTNELLAELKRRIDK